MPSRRPEGQVVYDKLLATGKLTVRVELAQFYDPSATRKPDGQVDYERILAQANAIRDKYAATSLIRADVIKIFADGVIEGNPFAVPPTLPDGASLKPWLQPIYAIDPKGLPTVTGYVDTASALCQEVRAHPDDYATRRSGGSVHQGARPPPGAVRDLRRAAAARARRHPRVRPTHAPGRLQPAHPRHRRSRRAHGDRRD